MEFIMKKINSICILLFLLAALPAGVFAQSERLEQDIRIAEDVLSELFRNQPGLHRSRQVTGQYIPGYGVHFKISRGGAGTFSISNSDDSRIVWGQQSVVSSSSGQNSSNGDSETSAEENIRKQITEYFTTYAPLLGRRLEDGEMVRVTYGLNNRSQTRGQTVIFMGSGDDRRELSFPRVSMWAGASDLQQFQNGNLTENQLLNRIRTYDFPEEENTGDLDIFASVLETALRSSGSKHLSLRGKPHADYLPGFGAHYHLQISPRSRFMFGAFEDADFEFEFDMDSITENFPEDIHIRTSEFKFDMDSIRKSLAGLTDSLRNHALAMRATPDSLRSVSPRVFQFNTSEADTIDLSAGAEQYIEEIKGLIRDYGPTLKSLSGDELLMITVDWGTRNASLPRRTEIQIRKSDLDRSREPVIEEIERDS